MKLALELLKCPINVDSTMLYFQLYHDYDIVVNCCGIGAHALGDTGITPIRGQVLRVRWCPPSGAYMNIVSLARGLWSPNLHNTCIYMYKLFLLIWSNTREPTLHKAFQVDKFKTCIVHMLIKLIKYIVTKLSLYFSIIINIKYIALLPIMD